MFIVFFLFVVGASSVIGRICFKQGHFAFCNSLSTLVTSMVWESVFCVATSEKSISGAAVNSEQVGLDTHVTTKSSPNMAPSSATTAALGAAAGPHTRQERLSAALQAGQAEPGAARSKAISEAVQAQSGAARSQAISEAISDQVQKEIDAQMVSHI